MKVINRTFRLDNTVSRIRRQLVDKSLFPLDVPRLCVYSEGDKMVGSRDVHDHVEEARRVGYDVVKEEKFLKAPHCSMLTEDAGRYWDAVQGLIGMSNDGRR